jgi:hypothetical protein
MCRHAQPLPATPPPHHHHYHPTTTTSPPPQLARRVTTITITNIFLFKKALLVYSTVVDIF